MFRITRSGRAACAAAALLAAATAAAAPAAAEITGAEEFARSLASELLGRSVDFDSLDADLGEVTRLRLENVTVGEAGDDEAPPVLELAELVIWVKSRSLISGPPVLPRLEARDGRILLDRLGTGEPPPEGREKGAEAAQAPEERPEAQEAETGLPRIRELLLSDVELVHAGRGEGEPRRLHVARAEGSAGGGEELSLSLDGSLDGEPIEVRFTGGSLDGLAGGGEPYPVDLRLVYGGVTLSADGTVAEPLALQGIEVDATLAGPNFANLYPLIDAALPATPPFEIHGALSREPGAIALTGFAGRMGDSRVDGSLTYHLGGERPRLTGNVHSPRLDFDDLAPLIGAEPDPTETASAEQAREADEPGLLPREPIPVERFRSADLDIALDAEQIVDAPLPIDRLKADFDLDDARLLVRPLELGLAGGSASGEIAVNARERPPSADLDIAFEEISLKPFFRGSEFIDEMGGRFSGELYLIGVGRSLDALLADATGDGVVRFRDGRVSGLIVEAAGLDVVEALALTVGDDVPVAVRCGGMALRAEHGRIEIPRVFVDTTDSLLLGTGELDLDGLTMALQVESRAKDFSLIDPDGTVRVKGPISDPSISIGGLDPLPFFETGEQDDVACERGYRMIERLARQRAERPGEAPQR